MHVSFVQLKYHTAIHITHDNWRWVLIRDDRNLSVHRRGLMRFNFFFFHLKKSFFPNFFLQNIYLSLLNFNSKFFFHFFVKMHLPWYLKPLLLAIEILSYRKSFLFLIFCFDWGGEFRESLKDCRNTSLNTQFDVLRNASVTSFQTKYAEFGYFTLLFVEYSIGMSRDL